MNGTPSAAVNLALPRVIHVTVTDDTLSADLEDGRTISVPIMWYPRLVRGTPAERANFQISGAGYGIHWPDLDEDIGVEGLLLGKRSAEDPASFERWLRERGQKYRKLRPVSLSAPLRFVPSRHSPAQNVCTNRSSTVSSRSSSVPEVYSSRRSNR